MEREGRHVWKVGLFVAVGLLVTAGIVLAIRDWRLLRSGYEIHVYFDSAAGLLAGAPVKFAGVGVGEVENIQIVREGSSPPSTHVKLDLWLPEGLKIRDDDQVLIGMLGLLGQKYVEILPGPGKGRILKAGDTLVGAGTVSELELTQRFAHVLTQLEAALDSANMLVTDPKILQQAENLARRLDQTTQQAEALMQQWRSVGEKSSSLVDEVRQWAPFVALGAALLIYLVAR
ncbi:MAG: hypothetical protein A2Z21_02955 [Candidatus Fraserbacteria bacterium RBG_16_55_9]|uniref:Mce/MlaD domain-containing protein n=1 Tax=Fraserbacteria sp. (strain RBG_16_55_9) TaxID=1817864 RepID=A0A1F5UU07_FRAXR|nr:MAG: hypothetical protein A2Z21_02955 [Candidatus Fraserbacteria bacterium RBG_16_55_9]